MGERALVTGASSGIGREFAVQLATAGYSVLGVARREHELQKLCASLPGEGHGYITADLSTPEGVAAVDAQFEREHCSLFVNNAGYSVLQPFYASDIAEQRRMLAVNCAAVMELAHAFLRRARSGDALINLSSVVAWLPTPAQPVYSASKAFIAAFSECLWEEQRGRGVYVMGLCPGVTETGFIATATGGEADGQTLPRALTQSSAEVVAEALAALRRRRRAIVVTGRANRLLMQLPRLLSRHRLLRLLAVIGDPDRAL